MSSAGLSWMTRGQDERKGQPPSFPSFTFSPLSFLLHSPPTHLHRSSPPSLCTQESKVARNDWIPSCPRRLALSVHPPLGPRPARQLWKDCPCQLRLSDVCCLYSTLTIFFVPSCLQSFPLESSLTPPSRTHLPCRPLGQITLRSLARTRSSSSTLLLTPDDLPSTDTTPIAQVWPTVAEVCRLPRSAACLRPKGSASSTTFRYVSLPTSGLGSEQRELTRTQP